MLSRRPEGCPSPPLSRGLNNGAAYLTAALALADVSTRAYRSISRSARASDPLVTALGVGHARVSEGWHEDD